MSRVNTNNVQIGPHQFQPYRWYDVWFDSGRCKCCHYPRAAHPVPIWTRARAVGDDRKADPMWLLAETMKGLRNVPIKLDE